MDELLRYLIEKIVEHKEDIHLESIEQNGEVIFTIRLNEDDYGRLIGKKGKTINALRHLLNIYNIKKTGSAKRIVLNVDSQQPHSEALN